MSTMGNDMTQYINVSILSCYILSFLSLAIVFENMGGKKYVFLSQPLIYFLKVKCDIECNFTLIITVHLE